MMYAQKSVVIATAAALLAAPACGGGSWGSKSPGTESSGSNGPVSEGIGDGPGDDTTVQIGGKTYKVGDEIISDGAWGTYCASVDSTGTPDYPSYRHYAVVRDNNEHSESDQNCGTTVLWFSSFLRSGQRAQSQIFDGIQVSTHTGDPAGYSFLWIRNTAPSSFGNVMGFALGY
jgi:hypothetical protein